MSCLASGRADHTRHQSDQSKTPVRPRATASVDSLSVRIVDPRHQRLNRGMKSAGFGNGARHLSHAQPLPFCSTTLPSPVFRIERCEGNGRDLGQVVEDMPLLCRSQKCEVNRILLASWMRVRQRTTHRLPSRVQRITGAGTAIDSCNRARLVHARDVHGRGILCGAEARDQHTALRQSSIRRHADREHTGRATGTAPFNKRA